MMDHMTKKITSASFEKKITNEYIYFRRAKEKRLKKDAGRQRWSPYLRQLKKNGDIDSSLSDDRSEDGMTDYHGTCLLYELECLII